MMRQPPILTRTDTREPSPTVVRSRTALARGPAASRPGRRTRPGAERAGRRLPAVRGVLQPGRDRADAVADAGLAPADAAVEPVKRGREDPRQRAGGGT